MTDRTAIEALKAEAAQVRLADWAARHRWSLRRSGNELVGPCPVCGGHGKRDSDRFAINTTTNLWNCRKCAKGGDLIALVEHTDGASFIEALERITGRKASEPRDPAETARLRDKAEREAARQDRIATREREKARKAGYAIWREGLPAAGTPVEAYLVARGVGPDLWPEGAAEQLFGGAGLRYHPELPYAARVDGSWQTVHCGPAMLAALTRADGTFGAVHMTWLDLSRPKGKAVITDPETGRVLVAKKMRGSKGQRAAIRLFTPDGFDHVVMGEGIETTLTPFAHRFEPDTAYWAGGDLGHMAGRSHLPAQPAGARQNKPAGPARGQGDSGSPGRRSPVSDTPDLDDLDAFVPPEGVTRLTYLGDGDSDAKRTHAQLTRGCRRAMHLRPGLTARISWAGKGQDFNDMVMAQPLEAEGETA